MEGVSDQHHEVNSVVGHQTSGNDGCLAGCLVSMRPGQPMEFQKDMPNKNPLKGTERAGFGWSFLVLCGPHTKPGSLANRAPITARS